MSSWFGPQQYRATWQSSGPNELISQLETLDGGTEATRGGWVDWRMEVEKKTQIKDWVYLPNTTDG